MAFKPRISRQTDNTVTFESEPESHTIVACIRKDHMEIPTWPDQCVSEGENSTSYLILNKTTENSTILIPYPEIGTWYASFKLFCGDCEPCDCPQYCQVDYEDCIEQCELECITSEECSSCSKNCTKTITEAKGRTDYL